MFKSVWRLFRAVGYFLTGNMDAARKAISSNEYVVQAKYDEILEDKKKRFAKRKEMVSMKLANLEKKNIESKGLADEIVRYEEMKTGALKSAQKVVSAETAKGLTQEQIKTNPEYMKHFSAFTDFSSTLEEKKKRFAVLDQDIKSLMVETNGYKNDLTSAMRDIKKLEEEAQSATGRLISAKEEQEANDLRAGVSVDQSGKDLQELRSLIEGAEAKAKVSRELAGTDATLQENEYLQYAETSQSQNEFEALMGFAEKVETPKPAVVENVKLPE